MKALFHPIAALSIAAALVSSVAVSAIEASPGPHFGRWTVSDPAARFTAKGKLYKTIDIAFCGKDFCGVSVGDKGQCGPTLFRFLTKNARKPMLQGHGKWGNAKKNIQIENWENPESPSGREMEIYVGDGYDFGGRSDSMPKYNAVYKRVGQARCKAR
jgi:hypothetical protein